MRQGVALVLSAPSGAGKSTLCSMLLAENVNLSFSISCTTRPKRENEIDGRDYHFLNQSEFEKKRENGDFAEWAQVHGNFYGTPLKPVQDAIKNGQDILFDIDVQGAAQLRLSLPHAIFIFIAPPSLEELEKRLLKRGTDNPESIKLRLKNAVDEFHSAPWYNYLIINNELEHAFTELCAIYKAATLRTFCNRNILYNLFSK